MRVDIFGVESLDPVNYVRLLLHKILIFLLLFCFRLQFDENLIFDKFEQDGAELEHLVMHDVNAFHLHVCIRLICLVLLNCS